MATLVTPENVDPIVDAEALRKASEGWFTNERGIMKVICHRNASQKKLIKEAYEKTYKEDLVQKFVSKLTGNFKKAVHRWMLEPCEQGAVIAYDALKKDDFRVLVEITCLSTADEFLDIKRAYQARYQLSLEEDVASHFTGDLRQLILLLVSVNRNDSEVSDPILVESEAKILHECINKKEYNHEEVMRIMTTRSKAQLISTLYRFKDLAGTQLVEALNAEEGQDYVAALQAAIQCISSPSEYLEQVLTNALMKHGTNKEALTRVIVTRAEKDLGVIKELFYKRHSRTLEEVVQRHTFLYWDYKPFLLGLLGRAKP